MSTIAADARFEEDVRSIASQLFPGGRARSGRYALGRERDGLFDDGDTIHIFEATRSRKKDKVVDDVQKSGMLVSQIRRDHPTHNVKIWIVTEEPPTADQEQAAIDGRKRVRCPIEIVSYSQLYSKLFNAREFIQLRNNYAFGSVRKPEDVNDKNVPEGDYIQVGLLEKRTGTTVTAEELSKQLLSGAVRGVILGDYGAGKSMALRHIYLRMASAFLSGATSKFPVYLNLRDHFGQSDPAEALMRHATKIGLSDHTRLIGAWRAGFVNLILDGFDELSPAQFATTSKNLRRARQAAAELVAQFVYESPTDRSILISGRRHYFDSSAEMFVALNVDQNWSVFDLSEFNDDQIRRYLKQRKIGSFVPAWLPRRPLLIGYLAVSGMLNETIDNSDLTAAEGWSHLLDKVCEREVRQVPGAPVEPATLRIVLERLATLARSLESGRGPIPAEQIIATYEAVFGQAPDSRTQTLLLRLPGLATTAGVENAREFLDDDLVDACRTGDVLRFIADPFGFDFDFSAAEVECGPVAIEGVAQGLSRFTSKHVSAAISEALSRGFPIPAVDLIRASIHANSEFVGPPVVVRDTNVHELDIYSDQDYSRVTFQDCWIDELTLYLSEGGATANLPTFRGCIIAAIAGVKGAKDLPLTKLGSSNEIESYQGFGMSNAEILTSEMPLSVGVLLTILKKTFFQSGGGRQEAALYRGLDHRARSYVEDILDLMERHGFLKRSKRAGPTLWLSSKDKLPEAWKIRERPMTSQHPLIKAVRKL